VVLLEKLAQEEYSALKAKEGALAPGKYDTARAQIAKKYEERLNVIFGTKSGKEYLEFLEDRNKKRPPAQISI